MRWVIAAAALVFAVALTGQASAVNYLSTDETHIEQLVNGTRASKGAHPLVHDAGLQQMARAQAVRMAARGDIYHNPNLSGDITALGYNWKMVGENVGMGPDADLVYGALLKSPHHYENIVRPNFTSIGVGIVPGPGDRIYLVQVFAEIVPAAKPQPAAVKVLPAPVITHPPASAKPLVTASAARPAPVVRRPDPNALVGGRVFRQALPVL